MPTYSGDFIANLKPGDHLCCLYETEEEHQALLTPFLRQGLEQGEKVLYIVDAHTAEHVLGYLRYDGLDVEPYLAHGQLAILTRDDAYLREGRFDPDGMIALLRAEMEQAVSEGYPVLRLTGEMTWALRGLPGSERLMEYEAKLNEFFPGSQCLAICQYDRRRFQPEVLSEVLCTHPLAIVGNEVYDNSYYMPPAEFLGEDQPAARLRNWLRNLADRKRAEAEATERAERLEALHQVGQALSQSLDLDTVVASALEVVLRVMGLDGGVIRYVDESTQQVVVLSQRGLPLKLARQLKARPGMKIGQGLAGMVVQSGQTLVVEDLSQYSSVFYQATRHSGFQSYVGLPLKVKGKVVGAISGYSRRQYTFTATQMEMMGSIGNMVGMAIANARLFDQVEAKGREWEQTFNSMGDGAAIISPDFRILRANRAMARMVGTTPEALVGQHCYRVVHGLDRPIEACPTVRCMSEKRDCELVVQEPHLGNPWLHVHVDPLLDAQGEMLGVVHTIRDITREKHRQEHLERLNRLSRSLSTSLELKTVLELAVTELAPASGTVAIALLDEAGTHLEMVAAHGLHGEESREVTLSLSEVPRKVLDLLVEKKLPLLLEDASRAPEVLLRLPWWQEYRTFMVFPLVVRDRAMGVLTLSSTRAGLPPPEEIGFFTSATMEIAMAVDNARLYTLTDAALRQRAAELESIMASMGEGLVMVDAQRRVAYCNRAAQELLGLNTAHFLGQPVGVFNDLLSTRVVEPKDWRKVLAAEFEKVGSRPIFRFLVQLAERREIDATLFPIERGGIRLGTGALLRDVTQERQVDRMKTEFISIASHELRTPMTVVYGFAELLLNSVGLPEEQREWLERIYRESGRLSDIIEDLLNVSRIEMGRLSLKLEAVALEPITGELIGQLSPRYPAHSFRVDIPGSFREIWADADKLIQVLYNLVDNAAKYSPQGGPVVVSARKDEESGQAVIAVADQGLGIPEAELPRLFTRFHRIHRLETEGIRGTGLGLYIVKSLVEMMGGRVWAESKAIEGSTFCVALPLAEGALREKEED